MKRSVLIILILLQAALLKAANPDSLRNGLLHAVTNDRKIHLNYWLGRTYADDNPDSSDYFYTAAFNLAGPLKLDSASMEAACAKGGLLKFSDGAKAKEYFLFALQCAQKLHRSDMESFILTELGALSFMVSDYHIAMDYYRRAMAVEVQRKNRARQAMLWSRIGTVYSLINDFPSALDAFNNSLLIEDSLKRLSNVAANYGEIAIVFSKQKKYAEALKYCAKDDSIMTLLGDTMMVLANCGNRGIIYKNMGNYAKAISLYNEVLTRHRSMDSFQFTSLHHNLAVALALNGQFREAEANFQLAAGVNERVLHNNWFRIQNDMEFARAKLLEHDIAGALVYARAAEKTVIDSKASREELKDVMALYSEIYKAKGDFEQAYNYSKKYAALQDSIFHEQQQKNIAEAETRLNLLEKDNEVAQLYKQNELQKLKSQKENIVNISLLAGLLLVAVFVVLIARAYRKTLKQNDLLTRQKSVIDAQVRQLAEAGTMKSRFFANISHELRTPITILTGMLELLQDKLVAGKEKEKLAVAFSNSRKLQQMVEEMLDLSRVESGLPVLKKEQKNICQLTKRIVYAFETLMDKKDIKLSYNDYTSGELTVMLDEDKYEKIVNNLLYNAIKFNREGGSIHVQLDMNIEESEVLVTVKDSGRGISPEDLPHIFERFYQGASAASAESPGAGIGLSLVKEFARMQGGDVSVSSILNEGSSFTLKFPVINTEEKETSEEETLPTTEILWQKLEKQPQVLIVEDNVEMRYYLREILGGTASITEAANGLEGLSCLESTVPDLIISDVMMPEMDGETFVGRIKKDERLNKIPVIMLTALATKEDQLRMLAMGVDDYIIKPFNAGELKIRVYNLLHNQQVRKTWGERPAEPDEVVVPDKEAVELQERIQTYVMERIRETSLSVHDLANHLALSERQLYRLANTLTGCTPAQLIKEVRLRRAYDMLVAGEVYKVEDLARRVGFENSSYFSRQFLGRFGKRPAEFL